MDYLYREKIFKKENCDICWLSEGNKKWRKIVFLSSIFLIENIS